MLSLMALSDSSNDILSRPDSLGKLGRCNIFILLSICLNCSSIFFSENLLLFLIFTFFFFCFSFKSFFLAYLLKLVIFPSLFFWFVFVGLSATARCHQVTYRPYYIYNFGVSTSLHIGTVAKELKSPTFLFTGHRVANSFLGLVLGQ